MSLTIIALARRAAALSSHYGPDDERTQAAWSQWRVAKLLAEIDELHDDDRAGLLAALTADRAPVPAHL
jgi:hypothetical protein